MKSVTNACIQALIFPPLPFSHYCSSFVPPPLPYIDRKRTVKACRPLAILHICSIPRDFTMLRVRRISRDFTMPLLTSLRLRRHTCPGVLISISMHPFAHKDPTNPHTEDQNRKRQSDGEIEPSMLCDDRGISVGRSSRESAWRRRSAEKCDCQCPFSNFRVMVLYRDECRREKEHRQERDTFHRRAVSLARGSDTF